MKIALLIDGSNITKSANRLDFRIDYKKILPYFSQKGEIFRALYFTALPPREVECDLRRLTDWLKFNGYNLVTKQTSEYTQSDGTMKVKGNMDIEMAVHMYEIAQHVDEVVIFTGDGDFKFVTERVQQMGKKVTAVSAMALMSQELRAQVDTFINLEDIRPAIMKTDVPRHIIARRRAFIAS